MYRSHDYSDIASFRFSFMKVVCCRVLLFPFRIEGEYGGCDKGVSEILPLVFLLLFSRWKVLE